MNRILYGARRSCAAIASRSTEMSPKFLPWTLEHFKIEEGMRGPDMQHLSDDLVAELNETARRVQHLLVQAGLKAEIQPTSFSHEGAIIEIDTIDDSASGVYVKWRPHPTLNAAGIEAVERGDFDDENIRLTGRIVFAMKKAMEEILTAGGFMVESELDDMIPESLRVSERRAA